jgi:hypothetical protein
MSIRVALIAIAGTAATIAGAQPDKDQPPPKGSPATAAPVVLASASDGRNPSATAPAQPVRRPAPRVTTCRCGDPQLSQNQSAEEQPDD